MFLIHTAPEHAEIVARAVVSACRLEGWQSPVQPKLLHTLLTGCSVKILISKQLSRCLPPRRREH